MPKLCEYETCQKVAYYSFTFMKPTRCKEHKLENQKSQTCICVCGKAYPSFGLKSDKRPSCCSICRTTEMIDIGNKKCKCGKAQPCFGLENDKKPSCCNDCRTDIMIDLVHKKCKCGKARPSFGLITDKKSTCCIKCKTDVMIDITHNKCKCGKARPSFGLENDKIPRCCKDCRTDIMIDVTNKRCICGKTQPSFGLITDKAPSCCSKCKSDIMIDIVSKRCVCGNSTSPCFGLSNDIIPTCCSKCKSDIMIDIVNKKCKCGKFAPSYGFENNKIRICCNECRTPEMINIISKKCKSNTLENNKKFICEQQGNMKYKGYCTRCYAYHFPNDPLTFQIRSKTKEIAVRDFINSQFDGFYHDVPLWISACKCTHRRRIDHRKLIGNTLLCIETDENQHKYYKEKDERIRYDDLMMIHGGKFIFIRFNPDKYKENGVSKNPTIA